VVALARLPGNEVRKQPQRPNKLQKGNPGAPRNLACAQFAVAENILTLLSRSNPRTNFAVEVKVEVEVEGTSGILAVEAD
jgi:hypothetical protein